MPAQETLPLLQAHAARYPAMQPQDYVKLLYQNEYGGGHMIADPAQSLARLKAEYAALVENSAAAERFTAIGNGLTRLHLAGLSGLSLTTVNALFVHTANTVRGNRERFLEKLRILEAAFLDGLLPCAGAAYLTAYRAAGCPQPRHSAAFQKAYAPAYRVVTDQVREFFPLFLAIDELLTRKGTVHVAIDGNSGAGKSTLAALLAKVYDCTVFHMDDFFLRPEQRTPERFAQPGGNIDHERFTAEILAGLGTGQPFTYRPFDCGVMALGEPVPVAPRPLRIIEGVYSLHPALSHAWDLKVFLRVDPVTQSGRILARGGPGMHRQFLEKWIPLENRYFSGCGVMSRCDLILP